MCKISVWLQGCRGSSNDGLFLNSWTQNDQAVNWRSREIRGRTGEKVERKRVCACNTNSCPKSCSNTSCTFNSSNSSCCSKSGGTSINSYRRFTIFSCSIASCTNSGTTTRDLKWWKSLLSWLSSRVRSPFWVWCSHSPYRLSSHLSKWLRCNIGWSVQWPA